MGRRSRSRSPKRERRRSRDRDRERDRDRDRKNRRSRSRSPRRRRSRSPRRRSHERRYERDREREWERERERSRHEESPKKKKNPPNAAQLATRPPLDASAFIGKSEEEVAMMNIMGFGNFDTTKGKHVPGNDVGDAHIVEKRRYRQYMNRRGGFNRPLDPIA